MVKKMFYMMIGVLLCMGLLSSCGYGYPHKRYLDETANETKTVKDTGEAAINAILNNDVLSLKTLLSKKAIGTDDLEDGFNYVYQKLTESEIVEIEQSGCHIGQHFGKNQNTKKGTMSFRLTTKSGIVWAFRIEYWFYNQVDESLVGLNRILLLNMEDAYKDDYDREKFSDRSGIYNPNWGNFSKDSNN